MRYNRYVHFGAARTLSAWLVVLDPLCALCRTRHGTNRSRAGRGGGRRRCTGDQDRAGHWIFGLIVFSSSQKPSFNSLAFDATAAPNWRFVCFVSFVLLRVQFPISLTQPVVQAKSQENARKGQVQINAANQSRRSHRRR